jgi:hypothetical protein
VISALQVNIVYKLRPPAIWRVGIIRFTSVKQPKCGATDNCFFKPSHWTVGEMGAKSPPPISLIGSASDNLRLDAICPYVKWPLQKLSMDAGYGPPIPEKATNGKADEVRASD